MKCIEEQCQYYTPHYFMDSYFTCSLTGISRTKHNKDNICHINTVIKEQEEGLKELKKYAEKLELIDNMPILICEIPIE